MSVIIDEAALAAGALQKNKTSILSPHFWHKITVKNAIGERRDLVLQALMDSVWPNDFIPVQYQANGYGLVSFMVKNCGPAVLQLCQMNLTVPHPDTSKHYAPFLLTIILKEKHSSMFKVDIEESIVSILKRRYIPGRRCLSLEQFHLDQDLTEYCPLSQPKLLYFVLHLARNFDVAHIKLAKNDIEILKPFEVLFADCNAKNLVNIDLRKNKIKSMEEISVLKEFPLVELNIEDNPICNDYKEHHYIKTLMNHFPQLSKLDGCRLNPNGIVPLRRNFVCSYSAQELIDKFIQHYFLLYDSPDRFLLENMYHTDAVFTVTTQFIPGQTSSLKATLLDFQKYTHNIKLISNYSKCDEAVYIGPQKIIKVLTLLPPTEHDPYTFTVDLIYFQDKVLVLTVTGVFKHLEKNIPESDQLYNFMRTFVLKEVKEGEYKIVNEVMNITNATSSAHLRAFKLSRVPDLIRISIPQPRNREEQSQAVEAFTVLTNMKREWARKCLAECNFDMRKSLLLFVDLFKGDKLPIRAFNGFETFERSQIETRSTTTHSQLSVNSTRRTEDVPPKTNTKTQAIDEDYFLDCNDNTDNDLDNNDDDTHDQRYAKIKAAVLNCPKTILDAITMPQDINKQDALDLLNKAADYVLTVCKDNLWYYKLVGMEFYRKKLLNEARVLLLKSRALLPSDEFEILSNIFLIFEIQHGTAQYVDKLVMKKIEAGALFDVLNLITRPDIKVEMSLIRSLFVRMTKYELTRDKLIHVFIAFHDFEVHTGNPQFMDQFFSLAQKHFRDEMLYSRNVYYKKIPRSSGVQKRQAMVKVSEECLDEFRRFRVAILKPLGIFNDEIDDPKVRELMAFTGPDTPLLLLCDQLVVRYKKRFVIIKIVCSKMWERDLHNNIKMLLEKAKEFCNGELLDNLILIYKIKTNYLMGKSNRIKDVRIHINTVPTVQLLNFLEDLANEPDRYIGDIFVELINDPSVASERKRLIALEYKTYCLKMRKPGILKKAEEVFRPFATFEGFHYEETLEALVKMPMPFIMPKSNSASLLTSLIERYLAENKFSFMVGLHVIWMLFSRNFRKMARDIRLKCLKHLKENEDLHFKFFIVSSMLEAQHGDKNRAQKYLITLEKNYGLNINYICAMAECNILNEASNSDFDSVRDLMLPHILDMNVILDPEVQKVMFMYFNSWKTKYRIDVLPRILKGIEGFGNGSKATVPGQTVGS